MQMTAFCHHFPFAHLLCHFCCGCRAYFNNALIEFCCRYGDMRKTIGFKIRDMWYNLGECAGPSGNASVITEFVELCIHSLQVMQRE